MSVVTQGLKLVSRLPGFHMTPEIFILSAIVIIVIVLKRGVRAIQRSILIRNYLKCFCFSFSILTKQWTEE